MAPRYAPAVGGVERAVEGLARNLVSRGVNVEVVTTDPTATLPRTELLDGVRVRRFPTLANDNVYFVSPALGWWLQRNAHRFTLLHAHSYHTPLALQAAVASRTTRTPLIVSTYFHGTGHSPVRTALHVPYRLPGRWLVHQAKWVICMSQAERELVLRNFGDGLPVEVIPPGLDVAELVNCTAAAEQSAGKLLLAVGRLDAYKQMARIVSALAHLPAHYRVVIVGDGPERERVEHIADLLDLRERVTLIPSTPRAELLELFRRADVYVSLSRQESFGISLLEAAIGGATVVASDIPVHRETLGYASPDRAAFVNQDCTPVELARAVVNAPPRWEQPSVDAWPLPTWDRVVNQTLEVYERVSSKPRRRLKVLMATPRFAPFVGGVETHVQEVSRRLVERGVDLTVVTADPTGKLPSEELRDGVRVRRVRAFPNVEDYYFAPGIIPFIARGDWDLIHCQGYHTFVAPLAMLAATLSRRPFVVTFHSSGDGSSLRRSGRGFQRAVLRPLLSRARRLVAVSQFEAQLFSGSLKLPMERFTIIRNGSDLPRTSTRTAHAESPVVVSVGRLERYKGHHRVLAAFPRVLQDYPSARLRIIGSGPFEPKLRHMAAQLGLDDRVNIGGIPSSRRADLARELGSASLVTLLSEYEAHPVAAMEALALGRQLLVADTSGLTELTRMGPVRAIPLDASPVEVGAEIVSLVKQPLPPAHVTLPSWDDCTEAVLHEYRRALNVEDMWPAS